MYLLVLFVAFFGLQCECAVPDDPGGVVGAKKFATANDCNGVVLFSASSGTTAANIISFTKSLADKGVGWSKETGEFTCHCPGVYQFSFSGTAEPKARLTLKKKLSNGDAWINMVSTGVGGGSVTVLINMEVDDRVAVFVDGGKLLNEGSQITTTTFSGFRVAKK